MSDQRLEDVVDAARTGAPDALRTVYELLAPAVVGYLRARGASEPEDLCSEVFLAVLPRIPALTGGAPGLRTLVFSVAHARLVDDLRRRSRRGPVVPYQPDEDTRRAASAEAEAVDAVLTGEVRALLATLPDDQRDVLLLRIVSDLTVDQVAEVIGRSPGAVKQLQRRGLLALRARADQSGRVL